MSVESKVKELLEKKSVKKGKKSEQLNEAEHQDLAASSVAQTGLAASQKMKKDASKASVASNAGDTAIMPNLGGSPKPEVTEFQEDETNLGGKAAGAVSKAPNPDMKGDAKTAKVPAMEGMHKKKKPMMNEDEIEQEEEIAEVDITNELNSIFGDELSEEFKTKATSIFEAAVIARCNNEIEALTEKLEEQNAQQLVEYKETLVEKVDSYLNYVVKEWLEENQLQVENGLKTEIAEEFMSGLQKLFKENYIEVPEDKYDVVEDLTDKVDALTTELDESVQDNITLSNELVSFRIDRVLEEQSTDLADTEKEKLYKLVEGVEYEDDKSFAEKVSVIKENYFAKAKAKSPEDALTEEVQTSDEPIDPTDTMSKYMNAISRQVKSKK